LAFPKTPSETAPHFNKKKYNVKRRKGTKYT